METPPRAKERNTTTPPREESKSRRYHSVSPNDRVQVPMNLEATLDWHAKNPPPTPSPQLLLPLSQQLLLPPLPLHRGGNATRPIPRIQLRHADVMMESVKREREEADTNAHADAMMTSAERPRAEEDVMTSSKRRCTDADA